MLSEDPIVRVIAVNPFPKKLTKQCMKQDYISSMLSIGEAGFI